MDLTMLYRSLKPRNGQRPVADCVQGHMRAPTRPAKSMPL